MSSEDAQSCEVISTSRLQFFPIMMFAVVMGLSGLTIVFQKSDQFLGFGGSFGTLFAIVDTVVFFLIVGFYVSKMFRYFGEVKKEFNHPVRINFFAASAISFLLMAIVYHDINHTISAILFYIGVIGQTFFTFYTVSFWVNKNLEIQHSNPAWFIPIVGNVLVPVAGVGIASTNFLMYYFSIGLFFWIILTAILINRIIFHHQLAVKFIPTLFIFIAPPAVAFIAYVKMYGEFDIFASVLFNLGLFFSFLLIFMYKNFMNLKFFISWWAFTFPLAAITIASMLAYHKTQSTMYAIYSNFFMVITFVVVAMVAVKTVKHMLKKEICIEE
jgi:tellurite resistance protein